MPKPDSSQAKSTFPIREGAMFGRLFSGHAVIPSNENPIDGRRLPAHGGVFALVGEDHGLIQLLAASSIRRAVAQRLAGNTGSRKVSLSEVVRHVWWRPGHSAFENDWIYLQIARQLLGPSYRDSMSFAPVWYCRIDMHADFPRWTVTNRLGDPNAEYVGPFATRKRATEFVADLEDYFDLCRYHDVLVRAPHGERCAYFDMGKCPAPCDGTIGLRQYRDMLTDSVRFATGDGVEFIERSTARMQEAAESQAYERALRLKEVLARAEKTLSCAGRFASTPDELCYLIVQRGSRRTTIRPFFCHGGLLETGAEITANEVTARVPDWLASVQSSDKSDVIDASYRAESLALVCHYLGKGEKASGVYLNVQNGRDCARVVECIQSRFFRS